MVKIITHDLLKRHKISGSPVKNQKKKPQRNFLDESKTSKDLYLAN